MQIAAGDQGEWSRVPSFARALGLVACISFPTSGYEWFAANELTGWRDLALFQRRWIAPGSSRSNIGCVAKVCPGG